MDPQSTSWAIDTLPLLALATALEGELYTDRGTDLATEGRRIIHAYTQLPADESPAMIANMEAVLSGTLAQRFSFAINTYLDGLLTPRRGSR